MTFHLSNHPLISHKLGILRDKTTKPFLFRTLISEIGSLLAYEATLTINTNEQRQVNGIFLDHKSPKLSDKIGIFPILRAGLGLSDPFLSMIPTAKVYHLGLYRDHDTLEPIEYYNKLPTAPELNLAIILDPMIATAGTACAVVSLLKSRGISRIIMVCVVAVEEGIKRLEAIHPEIEIYAAALDEQLNSIGYILPGLGDAGDRIFNTN